MKSKHLMTIYACVLLVYAGWRSADYMLQMLSGVNSTIANLIAAIFLFASEIGLLVWLYIAAPHATTEAQETTSTVLVIVNFVGSMALGLADLLVHNNLYDFDIPWLDPVLLLTPWVLVAANVGGHIIYHRTDADEKLKQAERALKFEERKLHIYAKQAAIENLQNEREALARDLAPHYFKDVKNRVTGQTITNLKRQVTRLEKAETPQGEETAQVMKPMRSMADYASTPNGNGRVKSPKVKG